MAFPHPLPPHRSSRRCSLPTIPMSPLPYVVRQTLIPFARPVRCRSHSSHIPSILSPSAELPSPVVRSLNTSPSSARSHMTPVSSSQFLLPHYSPSSSFFYGRPASPPSPYRSKSSLNALIETSELGFREFGSARQRRRSSVSFCGPSCSFDKNSLFSH
ncbi:hypothetical protein Tcan_15772 [Toxocara canis]|uniref:Uncharacterized protein n=1 Tax=Toxocara canis TaxID=6265 RepID=A0A0B2VBN6_TOXCA|nr:hypothetical protein Tcan_15772 [Toxocara canis]